MYAIGIDVSDKIIRFLINIVKLLYYFHKNYYKIKL